MTLKGMSLYEFKRDPYELKGMSLCEFKGIHLNFKGVHVIFCNPRPAARTLKRAPKQCLLFELGLAPGPPLCRMDQDNFLYGFLRGNSWFRLCWDSGFRGLGKEACLENSKALPLSQETRASKSRAPGLINTILCGFLKGNSWFRLCWDSGFWGSWKRTTQPK